MKIIISQIYKNINKMSDDIFKIQIKINNINKLFDNYSLIMKYKIDLIDDNINNIYNELFNNYKNINSYVLDYAEITENIKSIYIKKNKELLIKKENDCIKIFIKINEIYDKYLAIEEFVNNVMNTYGSELDDILLLEELNESDYVIPSIVDIKEEEDYIFF